MHAASPVSRRATRLTLAVLIPAAVATLAYTIIDHERSNALWAILLAFAFAVVAFGRWRRLTALAGLATTFAILLLFVVSAILEGKPPLWVAIVGSAAIMLVVLYLTHGVSIPTSMAVLGTLASLSLTGALAAASTSLLKLTGVGGSADERLHGDRHSQRLVDPPPGTGQVG